MQCHNFNNNPSITYGRVCKTTDRELYFGLLLCLHTLTRAHYGKGIVYYGDLPHWHGQAPQFHMHQNPLGISRWCFCIIPWVSLLAPAGQHRHHQVLIRIIIEFIGLFVLPSQPKLGTLEQWGLCWSLQLKRYCILLELHNHTYSLV